MSKFTRTLDRFLEQSGRSASEIERAAGFGNGWFTKLRAGATPTPEKVAALLTELPDDVARELLRNYLIDYTPEEWKHRTSISVSESPRITSEAADATGFDPTAPDAYDKALELLARHGDDQKVRRHIFSFIDLLDLR